MFSGVWNKDTTFVNFMTKILTQICGFRGQWVNNELYVGFFLKMYFLKKYFFKKKIGVWEQGYHIREFCDQRSHTRASQNGSYTRLTRVRSILRGTRVRSLIPKSTHVVSYKSQYSKVTSRVCLQGILRAIPLPNHYF